MKIPESRFPILIPELRDIEVPDLLPLSGLPYEPFTMTLTYVDSNPVRVGRIVRISDGRDEYYGTIESIEEVGKDESCATIRLDRKAG